MSNIKVNPHRPYYTPGLYHQHNYTSLPSKDSIPPLLEVKEHHAQLKGLTTRGTSFALLKYFVTMLTSPFEVGTTLLQVQYSPHQDVEVIGIPQEPSLSSSVNIKQNVKRRSVINLFIRFIIIIQMMMMMKRTNFLKDQKELRLIMFV
jgi:hypothetical protein